MKRALHNITDQLGLQFVQPNGGKITHQVDLRYRPQYDHNWID